MSILYPAAVILLFFWLRGLLQSYFESYVGWMWNDILSCEWTFDSGL